MGKSLDYDPAISFWGTDEPVDQDVGALVTDWFGVVFSVGVPGRIAGARYFQNQFDTQFRLATLRATDEDRGCPWATTMPNVAREDHQYWQQVWRRPWFRVVPDTAYALIFLSWSGHHWRTINGLAGGPITQNDITFIASFSAGLLEQSDFALGADLPGVDILFHRDS